jgi:hypothetical protein
VVLLKESRFDWVLITLIALLIIGANLPTDYAEFLNIDRKLFIIALIGVIAVSLVRYLKFTLIILIALLAIGANLPEELAKEFGVDPQIMLLGLVAMVVVSLANRFMKLPTGLDKSGRSQTAHGAAALFNGILKGRTAVVQGLIQQGVNVNVRTVSGKTPLMAAAYKGYTDIVQILLEGGADVNIKDRGGDTAMRMAARGGFTRTVDLLRKKGATG